MSGMRSSRRLSRGDGREAIYLSDADSVGKLLGCRNARPATRSGRAEVCISVAGMFALPTFSIFK